MKLLALQQFSLGLQYSQRCGEKSPKARQPMCQVFILFQQLRGKNRNRRLFLPFATQQEHRVLYFSLRGEAHSVA